MTLIRDEIDDQPLEPFPYEPTLNAKEVGQRYYEYLLQWSGIFKAIDELRGDFKKEFITGLQKVFDDWDNKR